MELLHFNHTIPFRVFGEDCDVHLVVKINDEQIYEQNFEAGVEHTQTINLDKVYDDASKNRLSFLFSGDAEIEKKYL